MSSKAEYDAAKAERKQKRETELKRTGDISPIDMLDMLDRLVCATERIADAAEVLAETSIEGRT